MPTGVRLLDRLGVLAKIAPERRHVLRGVGFVVNGRDGVCGDFPDVGDGFVQGAGHSAARPRSPRARTRPGASRRRGPRVGAGDRRALAGGRTRRGFDPQARYRARVVVGADGVRSLIRRKLGLDQPHGRRRRYGMRAHFTFGKGRPLPDYVTVYRDPGAECYTTPVSDVELEVALLVERGG